LLRLSNISLLLLLVAAALIESEKSLRLLAFAREPRTSRRVLPSWVPDWTRKEIHHTTCLPLKQERPTFSERTEKKLESVLRRHQKTKPDLVETLNRKIGCISKVLTPDEFENLKGTLRLVVCAVRLGSLKLTKSPNQNLSVFMDHANHLRGRDIFDLEFQRAERAERAIGDTFSLLLPGSLSVFPGIGVKDKIQLLAPKTAREGDEVFYVFGA